jgi:hypothetical protein
MDKRELLKLGFSFENTPCVFSAFTSGKVEKLLISNPLISLAYF